MIHTRRMYLGEVIGTVVAERKASGLEGIKLLLVQPLDEDRKPSGSKEVAVDTVQAGSGDLVYLVGSREAALALLPSFVPVDAAIVGIVDDLQRTDTSRREHPLGAAAGDPVCQPVTAGRLT